MENRQMYIADAVEETANSTKATVPNIKEEMQRMKNILRDGYKFYSQDLLNHLFMKPYAKIEFLQRDLQVSRITAASYLNKLSEDKVLQKLRFGKSNYYIHTGLVEILTNTK